MPSNESSANPPQWWKGVSRYEWLVLTIASAGWVFDVFEGQMFNLTRAQMLADILGQNASEGAIRNWGDIFLGVFLVGGTVGGLFFGWLGDRWGRRPTMSLTILVYAVFSGLTYFATDLWQIGALRFLVAMGVGGEWAVAAALVSEVFPQHARAHAGSIFHATSVFGGILAATVAIIVGPNWRYAYLIGVLPAFLILWVRAGITEPRTWQEARAKAQSGTGAKLGSFRDLLFNPRWRSRAILGALLAGVGLGTFWAVGVAGQDLAREVLLKMGTPPAVAEEKAKFAYGIIQAIGGGIGLLSFGPLCARVGRKRAFYFMQVGGLIIVPLTCYGPQSYGALLVVMPLFGVFSVGMHAGFAIYFPELFPNHLRSTGAGFCFNAGRLVAAGMLVFSGWFKALPGVDIRLAVTLLSLIFVPGLLIVYFLPETKGQSLPE